MSAWAAVAGGLALLALGGEILVRGAVGGARAFGVSPLLVGVVVVGFGTSAPELATSLLAMYRGSPGIALGNVVGSNTANVLLILGIVGLMRPIPVARAAFIRDGAALAVATAACLAAILAGRLDRLTGMVMLALLAAYVAWTYLTERVTHDAGAELHLHLAEDAPPGPRRMLAASALALGGLALTIGGARLLVDGAVEVARGLGIEETVIGLTIVAVGTSLPELVAGVVAALRRHLDVALGNVIGSNIYNIFGVLGATAAIRPIAVPPSIVGFDVWVMAAASLMLLIFLRTGWSLRRREAAMLLAAYLAYTSVLVFSA